MSAFNTVVEGSTGLRREPYIVSDKKVYMGLDYFYIPAHYKDVLSSILIPYGAIMDRVEKLAYDITQDYNGQTIHVLCVLKGASTFFGDLTSAIMKFHNYARETYIPYTFDFIRVKSYEGTSSTGNVQISGCDLSSFAGKHVLFVEDIVDTGLTMSRAIDYLRANCNPKSVRVVSLLEKRTDKSCGFKADYVGFSIPDEFVVGYCLDYNEVYRDLPHIAVINQAGIEKFRHFEHA
eukprot:CAMPEP_0174971272 /NCGR_PEP_ID=MMETSP0004_2-20121128/9890_1 /TAXON_ID=420556 /ORGANISM="Ochromonas sp., Strain CCMP1393" /LENGTH=234 /DNA_ID=CAMNT_0016221183 /DNA_START=138 /DNA_END=842 /DNA_ORIENTATION=-